MDGTWHDELEGAKTVEEAVASVKLYLGALPASSLGELSRHCRPSRITADADVDDLTLKVSHLQRRPLEAAPDAGLARDLFDFLLHASLRISQLNRMRASGVSTFSWRRQMAQMG